MNKQSKILFGLAGIPLKVWNGIDMNEQRVIAQELPPTQERRRWVALYAMFNFPDNFKNSPYIDDFIRQSKDFNFCVIYFEMLKEILDNNDGIDSSYAMRLKFFPANTEEELITIFKQNNIHAELFVPPWRCDYPLFD